MDLPVPFPPVAEQAQIEEFIEREAFVVTKLTSEAQQAIALLQERRAALISAAVTGKIDVRERVPAEVT